MYLLHYHSQGNDSYEIVSWEVAVAKMKKELQENIYGLDENIYLDQFDEEDEPEIKKLETTYEIFEYMANKMLKKLDEPFIKENGYTIYYADEEYTALVVIKNNEGSRT